MPADHGAVLEASLERQRLSAWEVANYEREQRDQLSTRFRFASGTLNAASLVTILNLQPHLQNLTVSEALTAAAAFFVGTVLSGLALNRQEVDLIETAGQAKAWAMTLDRAASLAALPDSSPTRTSLPEAMREAERHQAELLRARTGAYALHRWSTSFWIAGVVAAGVGAA